MQRVVNTEDETELPGQASTVFVCSSKKHEILSFPDGRLYIFCWLNVDIFDQVLLSIDLTGSSICWIL